MLLGLWRVALRGHWPGFFCGGGLEIYLLDGSKRVLLLLEFRRPPGPSRSSRRPGRRAKACFWKPSETLEGFSELKRLRRPLEAAWKYWFVRDGPQKNETPSWRPSEAFGSLRASFLLKTSGNLGRQPEAQN